MIKWMERGQAGSQAYRREKNVPGKGTASAKAKRWAQVKCV